MECHLWYFDPEKLGIALQYQLDYIRYCSEFSSVTRSTIEKDKVQLAVKSI